MYTTLGCDPGAAARAGGVAPGARADRTSAHATPRVAGIVSPLQRPPQLLGLPLVLQGQRPVGPCPALVDVGAGVALDGTGEGLDGLAVVALAQVHLADQTAHVRRRPVRDRAAL